MESTGILRVRYAGKKETKYQGLEVSYKLDGKDVVKTFDTGDAVVDYLHYFFWVGMDATIATVASVIHSSSFDSFLMNTKEYETIHVKHKAPKTDSGEWTAISYTNEQAIQMPYNKVDKLREYIVKPGMTTFEELKAYYRQVRGVPEGETLIPVEYRDPDENPKEE